MNAKVCAWKIDKMFMLCMRWCVCVCVCTCMNRNKYFAFLQSALMYSLIATIFVQLHLKNKYFVMKLNYNMQQIKWKFCTCDANVFSFFLKCNVQPTYFICMWMWEWCKLDCHSNIYKCFWCESLWNCHYKNLNCHFKQWKF